ncbi:hypothetical protein EJD97_022527 [Solanum chilense]|uniref:S-locus F-box protein type-12 n=1 Tax=Solanum chilense TaxID=4083 RepID=A0A6N2AVK2_SOLCI|nr:hypothetical protein EJD97_022527 [Solanum chilense]
MMNGTIKKLSEDVEIYIFFKLPMKSIMRFKCVTKTWCNLIQSFSFINLHHNYTSSKKDEFILFKRSLKEQNVFTNPLSFLRTPNGDDDLDYITRDLEVPYLSTGYGSIFHQFNGPCHGLIVLTDYVNFVILNPATRNYRLLPKSPFVCPRGFYRAIGGVGFVYDAIQRTYKVVRISEISGEEPFNDPSVVDWIGEVYDFGVDSWRNLPFGEEEFPWPYNCPFAEMYYKGVFHWYAHRNLVAILCFDSSTEVFRIMQVPEMCSLYDEKVHCLTILDECLTFICYPDPRRVSSPVQEITDIWIMKEYNVNDSWIKKFTIRCPPIESPLAIWNDSLLLLQDKRGIVISYNLNSDKVEEYKLHGYPGSLRIIVYKESLMSIPKGSTQVENY